MNELHLLFTLATVHFIALMSPGPDFALVVQNASRFGRQTGFYIALGLSFGILTHAILSVTGVSYLVQQQPLLFSLLQAVGGGYLLYLGIGALLSTLRNWQQTDGALDLEPRRLLANKHQAFTRGFMTNLLNPKALVFFVTLVSTLIPTGMSFVGKGAALFIIWSLSVIWFGFLAWMLAWPRLQRGLSRAGRYIDLICGALFSGLGAFILYQILFVA